MFVSVLYIFVLINAVLLIIDKWIPDAWEIRKRDEIVHLLQNYISSIYPTAVLTLFGSSKNGFGSKRSDLDICLTFSEEDARKVILSVCVVKYIYYKKQDISLRHVRLKYKQTFSV